MRVYRYFILILFIPVVFADIEISTDRTVYNMGEKIALSVSLVQSQDVNFGSFETIIKCGSFEKEYFILPDFDLDKDYRKVVDVHNLTVKKIMLGGCERECSQSCYIKAVLKNELEEVIEEKKTEDFSIQNNLEVTCGSIHTLPGRGITLSCDVAKPNGLVLEEGEVEITYGGTTNKDGFFGGKIQFLITIPQEAVSGTTRGDIKVFDDFGNYGEDLFEIVIEGIPTSLETRLTKDAINPGETFELRPILFDHNSDVIEAEISIEITDPDGEVVVSKSLQSLESFEVAFDTTALPGVYSIKASARELDDIITFIILEKENPEIVYSNQKIFIKNLGNVIFKKDISIVLENEDERFVVEDSLKLDINDIKDYDLSKEVTEGTYDISFQYDELNFVIAKESFVHDNRPWYKKAGKGLSLITGAATATVEFATRKPLATGLILLTVILTIVFFYSKDLILDNISFKANRKEGIHINKKKEEDDIKDIFEDFDYERR